jgi:uncharacterized RDD family membrane protein YckC
MNCPVCGSLCPCIHAPKSAPVLGQSDDGAQICVDRGLSREESDVGQDECDLNWRKEVASRVQQHRYRRGNVGDAAEAMELEFAADEALTVTDGPVIRALHRRNLAHDQVSIEPGERIAVTESARVIRFPRLVASLRELEERETGLDPGAYPRIELATTTLPRITDVVEQPSVEPARPDELAQPPQIEPPRAPEQMELLPSFEDIQLEPAYASTQPDMEIIPRPACLQERLVAGLVDLGLVALAAVLFGYSFIRMSEDTPHSRLAWLFALCVGGILWILFQYLFLVHGNGTPGMLFARLELRTFEGRPVNANTRRIRAAASALSALSIGLGYAWAFVDEDRLGWHDRMTRTLLRSRTQPSTTSTQDWDWDPV